MVEGPWVKVKEVGTLQAEAEEAQAIEKVVAVAS